VPPLRRSLPPARAERRSVHGEGRGPLPVPGFPVGGPDPGAGREHRLLPLLAAVTDDLVAAAATGLPGVHRGQRREVGRVRLLDGHDRYRPAVSNPRNPDDLPVLVLEQFNAGQVTKPGSKPLVHLRLGGVTFDGGSELVADFVMFPDEARALIAELQQALPD
jgi:hypothetical protein